MREACKRVPRRVKTPKPRAENLRFPSVSGVCGICVLRDVRTETVANIHPLLAGVQMIIITARVHAVVGRKFVEAVEIESAVGTSGSISEP